jgi:hypothetical protein
VAVPVGSAAAEEAAVEVAAGRFPTLATIAAAGRFADKLLAISESKLEGTWGVRTAVATFAAGCPAPVWPAAGRRTDAAGTVSEGLATVVT